MLGLYIGFSLRMSWQTKWEIWVHGGALEQQDRSSRIFFTALQTPQNLNPAQMATLLEQDSVKKRGQQGFQLQAPPSNC